MCFTDKWQWCYEGSIFIRVIDIAARENNWPPLPDCVKIKPCFYQDFEMDIASEFRKIVRFSYYMWICKYIIYFKQWLKGEPASPFKPIWSCVYNWLKWQVCVISRDRRIVSTNTNTNNANHIGIIIRTPAMTTPLILKCIYEVEINMFRAYCVSQLIW